MKDHYCTIASEAVEEIKVKGSRFIGRIFEVTTDEEMTTQLTAIRKLEYNASHNCYAYLIGIDEKQRLFKYSDDGEPNGTAGKPIYDVLNGTGVTNALLIITRYFGGTKLGTGGLVKAYSECAKKTVESAGVKDNYLCDILAVELEFPMYNQFQLLLQKTGATQREADFSDIVKVEVEIRQTKCKKLIDEITGLTNGKAKIEKKEPA